MGIKKVSINELIKDLKIAIENIESSDIPQSEKTRKFKAEAKKFKSKLFTDKRKFRGEGLKNRITLNTYNAYLSRARKPFDDKLHHSFKDMIERLGAKYPAWAAELSEWGELSAPDIRKAHGEMLSRLRDIPVLTERLGKIKLGQAGTEKKLAMLASTYPAWRGWLMELAVREFQTTQKQFYEAMRQGLLLLDELQKLKINHEVVYSLRLEPGERASLQQRWGENLADKKRRTVTIDYPLYMQRVYEILTAPDALLESATTRIGMAPLAFALAASSGRRMIEIMLTGHFEKVDKKRLRFYGQAKKRNKTEADEGRVIYSLFDADIFLHGLSMLRNSPAANDFQGIIAEMDEHETRSENAMIETILAPSFNAWVKGFFADERRVYKDSRSLYARICYETWFNRDPRWANCDEDVFFAELLGHDDEDTQTHYKQFKLRNFSLTWKPVTGQENTRLAALEALDAEMPGFANGDAGVRMHEWVKEQIRENPAAKITTYSLRKNYGGNPQLAARYLAFAADALGQAVAENGRYEPTDTPDPIVIDIANEEPEEDEESESDDADIESDELEIEEEDEPQSAEPLQDKPRITPQQLADGEWQVNITAAGREFTWTGAAASSAAAMQTAWSEFSEETKPQPKQPAVMAADMPRPRLQLVDGWWTSEIAVDGKTLVYIEQQGSRDDILEATKQAWEKLSSDV